MDSLKRDGLYVFDRPLPSSLVDEMVEFAKTNPARLYPTPADGQTFAVFDPSNPLAGGYRFDEQPLLQQSCFQKLMGDPLLQAVTQAYLGVESKLAYISLWWSAVFERNPTSHMAQLYHVDLSHMKWLIMFVYLTDVSDSTGHHTFVRGSHQNDQEGLELRSRGLVRVCDEDIERVYRKDNIKDLVGPRGTVFIADTRAFHKGNMPRTGHRLMFQLYHVNSLFPDNLEKSRERTIHVADPTLEETIKLHPGKFDGYSVVSEKV